MTRSAPLIAGTLAALLLLFGAYMGAYYALLVGRTQTPGTVEAFMRGIDDSTFLPQYRADWLLLRSSLTPAHQLDRLIRPEHWKLAPPPPSPIEPAA